MMRRDGRFPQRAVPLTLVTALLSTVGVATVDGGPPSVAHADDTPISDYDDQWLNDNALRFHDPQAVTSTAQALPVWLGIGHDEDGDIVASAVEKNQAGLSAEVNGLDPLPDVVPTGLATDVTQYPDGPDYDGEVVAFTTGIIRDVELNGSLAPSEDLVVVIEGGTGGHGKARIHSTMADGLPYDQTLDFGALTEWDDTNVVDVAIVDRSLWVASQSRLFRFDLDGGELSLTYRSEEFTGTLIGMSADTGWGEPELAVVTRIHNDLEIRRLAPSAAVADTPDTPFPGPSEDWIGSPWLTVDEQIGSADRARFVGSEPIGALLISGETGGDPASAAYAIEQRRLADAIVTPIGTCAGATDIDVITGETFTGSTHPSEGTIACVGPAGGSSSIWTGQVRYDPGIIDTDAPFQAGARVSSPLPLDGGLNAYRASIELSRVCDDVERLVPGASCEDTYLNAAVVTAAASDTRSLSDPLSLADQSILSSHQLIEAGLARSDNENDVIDSGTVEIWPTWVQPVDPGFQMRRSSLDEVVVTITLDDDLAGCRIPGDGESKSDPGLQCSPPVVLKDPQPIGLLMAPPTVASAGQSVAAPSFGTTSTTSTGVSEGVSYSVGIQVHAGGDVLGNGGSIAAGFTNQYSTDTTLELTETSGEGYGGSAEDDTIIYGSTRVMQYSGEVVESSTGLGLGRTDDAFETPIATTTASSSVAAARERFPDAFGEYGFGPGITEALTHTIGDPGSYPGGNAGINDYCIGTIDGQAVDEFANLLRYKQDVFGNTLSPLDPEDAIRVGGRHPVTAGSSGVDYSTISYSESETTSWMNTAGAELTATAKVGADFWIGEAFAETSLTQSLAGSVGGSSTFGEGTSFEGGVGDLPSELLSDHEYSWKMFLCKRNLGQGYPVWVLNYAVENYDADPLAAVGDLAVEAPRAGAFTDTEPDLSFSATDAGEPMTADALNRSAGISIDIEGLDTADARTIELNEVASDAPLWIDQNAEGTFTLRFDQLDEEPLDPAATYRWRVRVADEIATPFQSEWAYFNTAGPPEARLVVEGSTGGAVTVGETITLRSTGETNGLDSTHLFRSGATVIDAGSGDEPTERRWVPEQVGYVPLGLTVTNAAGEASDSAVMLVAPAGVEDTYDAIEDTPLVVDAAGGVLANDDGVTTAELVDDVHQGELTFNDDGSFTWVPPSDLCGPTSATSFTYQGRGGGLDALEPTTVVLSASRCVNDPTELAASSWSMLNSESVFVAPDGALMAGASDIDGYTSDDTRIEVTQPEFGTVTVLEDWTFQYEHMATDWCGTTTFQARSVASTPGFDDLAGEWVTHTFEVICPHAPTMNDSTATATEDTALSTTLEGSDADGDELTFSIVTGPAHGTAEITDDVLDYTPAADFCGQDTVEVRASDGELTSDPAVVTIEVSCTDDAPVAHDDQVSTEPGTPVEISVLGNDTDVDNVWPTRDPMPPLNEGLSVTTTGTASNGTVTLEGTLVSYDPDPGFVGTDTFTYEITDGTFTASGTVEVTVARDQEPDDPSDPGDPDDPGSPGTPGDPDDPDDPADPGTSTFEPVETVQVATEPGTGGAIVEYETPQLHGDAAGWTVQCTPPSGDFFPVGTTTVTCTAVDGTGHSTDTTFTVTVRGTDLAHTGADVVVLRAALLLLIAGAVALLFARRRQAPSGS
ncbi:Ig-like domain-containing protein [Ruania rhizosphaerae]|uniref:Ig-like domain-containing protein n=1 Tax=Ruania rhizosphaerae TaxID=1840413 RepID=UPI00135CB5EE|nr:Ig-like domain-containing protein [Ruania rhizosphaerae]